MAYAKSKTPVGLYITKGSVTVAQVKPTLRGPRLIKSAQVKIKSEQPAREEIIEIIQEAFKQSKIENRGVVSGLVGKEVMIRFFRMPRIPKEERKNAVKFEAKKYIPFRIEEVASDFQVTEKKGEPKMEVIFAASKKDYINNHLSLLQQAGLTPVVLEPACFSILRTLYFTGQIKKIETVAVVNVDSSNNVEITVVRDGIPYLSRALTLTISGTQTLLDSLLNEIQISFDYYRRQFPGDSISRIILYGEEAELKEADESLSKELKIPVLKANPVKALGGKQYPGAEFSICFGLALKGLVKPQVEIELYTEEVVPEEKKRLIKATVAASLPAVLILVALYLFMSKGVAELRTELNKTKQARIKTDLVSFDASGPEMEEIKIEISEKLRILKRLIGERIYWTTKFNELPKNLPEGIWFEEIKLQERVSEGARRTQISLILKGNVYLGDVSGEMELLNKFLSDLKKNRAFFEGFQEAKLTSVKRGKSGDFEVTKFEISCSGRR